MSVYYVIGLAGSGKTTLAARFAHKAIKKGLNVYSNVPLLGAYELDVKNDFMNYEIHNGICIIDESAISFNSRKFKTMPDNVNEFVRLHRHAYTDIYVFSQNYNGTDKLFRDLAEIVILLRKSRIRGFGYLRVYSHDIKPPDELNPDFHDIFKLDLFSCRLFKYGRYSYMFDSFEMPILPEKDWNIYSVTNRFKPCEEHKKPLFVERWTILKNGLRQRLRKFAVIRRLLTRLEQRKHAEHDTMSEEHTTMKNGTV